MENVGKSQKVISDISDVDPDLTLAVLELQMLEREKDLVQSSRSSAPDTYCKFADGDKELSPRFSVAPGSWKIIDSLEKGRGRQIKLHETEPFLAIDSVPERKKSPLQNEGSINCQQPQKLQMRSGYRQRTPTSFGPLTSITRSPCSSPSPSFGCPSARSQGHSTNRFYVSPNAGGPRFNSCIKMPFKHSIRKPRLLENPGQEPGQELKELTALATYHMNRMLQADTHQLRLKRGQLLRGRLKPLVPVSVTGPRIEQCRGILSETRGYTPSASRTLQRRRELMKQMTFGEMDLHEVTMLPHNGSDSVHRVSVASSMEDLTNETAEEQGSSKSEYEKNDVLDIYFHGEDNTKQNLQLIHTNDAVTHRDEMISSDDSNILPIKEIFHMTAETTVYLNNNLQNSSQQVMKSIFAESENKDEKTLEPAQFTTSETSSEVKTDFTHNKELINRRNQNENKMINTGEGPVDNTERPQGELSLPLRRPYSAGSPHTAVHALFHAEMRPSTSATKSVHFADEMVDIHENKHKAKLSNPAENIEPYIIDKCKDKGALNTHTSNESRRGSDRFKEKCADLDIFTSNDSERGSDRAKKKYADLDILTRFDSDKGSERAEENCVDLDVLTSNDSDRDSDRAKENCADVVVHANSHADSRELKKIVSQSIVGENSLASFAKTEQSPVAARGIVDCKYQSSAFSAVHQTTTSKGQGKRGALPKDVINKKEKMAKVPKGRKKTFPKHIHYGVKVTFPEHTLSNREKSAIPKSVHNCKIQATFPKYAQNCEIKITVPKLIPNCEEKTTVPKHVTNFEIKTVVPKQVPDGAMYTTALKHVGENKTVASKPVFINGEHFLKCILENSKEKSFTSLTHLDHTDVINECKETASPNHIKPNGMKEAKASKYTIPDEEKDAKTSIYTIPNEEKDAKTSIYTIPNEEKDAKTSIYTIPNEEKETKTPLHTIPNGKKETKTPKHATPNGKKALKDHKLPISNRVKEATDSTHSMPDGENEAKVPKCTIPREEEANVLKHTISNGEKEAQDPKHAIPNGDKALKDPKNTIPNKEQEANCSSHAKKKKMKAPKHITPNEEKGINSFHYDVTSTNREKYAKTTKQSISNGENLLKPLLWISSQKGESSTSLNQSNHSDTTRKEDQPHHSNIAKEDKDQPHHSNLAREDKDQPHHSNLAREDKDQPHHSNIAKEDKDQPHHSNLAREDKDQPHHSNLAREDKDQPNHSNIAREDKDQLHHNNIAKEDKDQPHHSNLAREDKDQPHHSNIAKEDKDQPHHSNIAREDKDQPHHSNIAKEDKDQPHHSNIAREDKDQPHHSNIAKEDKDQPHHSNLAREDKDQPHHSNIAKGDKDQPHHSNLAREDKDQPNHSNIAREDKDHPHYINIAKEDEECALPDHVIIFGERKCSIHNEAIPRRESKVTIPELSVPRIESKVTVPELSVPRIESKVTVPELSVPRIESKVTVPELSIQSEEKGAQSYKHAIHKGEKRAKYFKFTIPKGDKDAKSPKFTILMREKNTQAIKHDIHSEEKVITGPDHTISNREKEAKVSKYASFTEKKETTFPQYIISNEEKEVTVPTHTISNGEVKASKYDTGEKRATFPKHIIFKGEKAGKAHKHIISNEDNFLKLLLEFSTQKGDSSTSLDQLDEIDSINEDKESAVFQHFISCGETEKGGHEHVIQYGEGETESHKHSINDRDKEVRPPIQAIHNDAKEAKSLNHVILDRDSEVKSVKHAMLTEDNEGKSHKHFINDRDSEVKSVKHAMLTEDNEAISLKHAIHKETNEAKIPVIVISNGTHLLKLLLEISAQRGDSVTSLDQSGHNDTISNMIENNISQSDHNDTINNMIEINTSNSSVDCTNSELQSHNFVIGQIKTDFGRKLPVVKIDDTRLHVGKLNCDNGNIHIRGNTNIAQRQQIIKENVDTGEKKRNGHELALSSFAGENPPLSLGVNVTQNAGEKPFTLGVNVSPNAGEKPLSFGVNVSPNAGEKPLSFGVNVSPNAGEKPLSFGVNVSQKDRDKNTKCNSSVKKASSKHTKCVYTHHSNHPFICPSNDSFSDAVARRLKFGNSPYLQELHVSAPSAKSWPTPKSHKHGSEKQENCSPSFSSWIEMKASSEQEMVLGQIYAANPNIVITKNKFPWHTCL